MPGLEKDLDELEYNIWIAAGEGHTDQVIEHLSDVGPDIQDDYGYTPLHAAASYGQDEIVRLLISDYKASVNIQDEQGDTALHLVEEVSTCKLLIELGADPQIRNEEGRLPIETAFSEGLDLIVDYLKQFTPNYTEYPQTDEVEQEIMEFILNQV